MPVDMDDEKMPDEKDIMDDNMTFNDDLFSSSSGDDDDDF